MMNCLVLGCGRSGTSMVMGTLAKAGFFMGDNLWPPRESNPQGFYEDREVNGINDVLIISKITKRPRLRSLIISENPGRLARLSGRWFFGDIPGWLKQISFDLDSSCSPTIANRIKRLVSKEPFCFKDPRFSYTLPVWRPFLNKTLFLCIFRHPATTALSIVKECQTTYRLRSLRINYEKALSIWKAMYQQIVNTHRNEGKWLFINYNQVLYYDGLDRLRFFLNLPLDNTFPNPTLHRSISNKTVPKDILDLYKTLCELAEYKETIL